jgi:hypothetical protein
MQSWTRFGAWFFEIGDKGQRQTARVKPRQRSRFVESGPKANSRKSLISMIISGSFSSFLRRVERPSLPSPRQDQKREKLFWTTAGAVYLSLVNVAGGSNQGQSHPVKANQTRIGRDDYQFGNQGLLTEGNEVNKERQTTELRFPSFPSVQESWWSKIALNRT